jgi:hypothetical protein
VELRQSRKTAAGIKLPDIVEDMQAQRKAGILEPIPPPSAASAGGRFTYDLPNREYLNLVLDGTLANLASAIAKHWDLAQVIRKERLQRATDHPLPTTK